MTDTGKDKATELPARAIPLAETVPASSDWPWVNASVWTERMLSAPVNGVKTGYFAGAGLFAIHTAWQLARQSR